MNANPGIPETSGSRWSLAAELFTRPYPMTGSILLPFCVWLLLVPCYLVIGAYAHGRTLHMPALALDRALPVLPIWTLIYGSLYLAVLLPLVVVRGEEHIRRTIWAFVMVWIIGTAGWLCYPTILPRPDAAAIGKGFSAWTLRIAYSWDGPYNCFPSLHVAQAFLAAFTCLRVSRGLGIAAFVWAALVGVSTLFTKQHYVVDVISGALLAWAAYFVLLRSIPRAAIPELDSRAVPIVVLGFAGLHALIIFGFWVAYAIR
jgi:membrane-associated phospholipid phosphatase